MTTPFPSDDYPPARMSFFRMHRAIGWILFNYIDGETYNDKGLQDLSKNLGDFIYEEVSAESEAEFEDGDVIHVLAAYLKDDLSDHFGEDLSRDTWPVKEPMPQEVRQDIMAIQDKEPDLYLTDETYETDQGIHAKIGLYFYQLVLDRILQREKELDLFLLGIAHDDPDDQIERYHTQGPKPG